MAGGCVPFAVPPGQASLGSATTAQRARSRDEQVSGSVRAAIHPLGFFDERQRRVLDLGTGYTWERVVRPEGPLVTEGPYLELSAYPLRTRAGSWIARGGVRTSGELLVADRGTERVGYGGSVGLAVEFAKFANGPFAVQESDVMAVGVAYGEGGVGGFLGVSHRRFVDDAYWVASAGITLRVPAAVGVACCVKP